MYTADATKLLRIHYQAHSKTKEIQVQTFFTLALQTEADARLNNTIFNRMQ